ncbi:MAG: hypothetical protein HY892_07875 [Deltaproteobacteria bacterium]|nr:hypothetical protein [Deltaproteobacteria bacterium]
MTGAPLRADLIEILQLLKKEGGTYCTGTCHHRQPGELHCHTLGRMLNISSQGVKNRLLTLLRLGLVRRCRVERPDSRPAICFIITPQAEERLASYGGRVDVSSAS